MEHQLSYSELEKAWESANLSSVGERPKAFVTSTRWLNLMGFNVSGPGPWLVTKDKITQIELED